MRAGLIVMSMIVTILAMELLLRVTGFEGRFANDSVAPYPQYYFRPDERSGFDIAENYPPTVFPLMEYQRTYHNFSRVWSNNLGCFDRPHEPQDPSIILVGYSFTWGYVPLEHTWGTVLEREMGRSILKCGVGAYGTRQERIKVEALLQKVATPDLILLAYFIGNDLTDDYLFPQFTVIDGHLITKVSLNHNTGERTVSAESDLEVRVKDILEATPNLMDAAKDVLAKYSEIYNLLRRSNLLRQIVNRLGMASPVSVSQSPIAPVFRSTEELPWLHKAWMDHLSNLKDISDVAKQSSTNRPET